MRLFWQFFRRVDINFMTERLVSVLPDRTTFTLGTPYLTAQDIINLPQVPDEGLRFPGNYICIVDEAGELEAYVGSANGRFGVLQRWKNYQDDITKGRQEKTKFHRKICRRGPIRHFRSLWNASANRINIFYNVAYESVFQVFLRTVVVPNSFSTSTLNAPVIRARYNNVVTGFTLALNPSPQPIMPGLNLTWSISQGCRWLVAMNKVVCSWCSRPWARGGKFESLSPGEPLEKWLCGACASARRKGKQRTREDELRCIDRNIPHPEDSCCELCGDEFGEGERWLRMLDTKKWACKSCYDHRFKNGKLPGEADLANRRKRQQNRELFTERPKDKLCQNPYHKPTNTNPKIEEFHNGLWLCGTCAAREKGRDKKGMSAAQRKKLDARPLRPADNKCQAPGCNGRNPCMSIKNKLWVCVTCRSRMDAAEKKKRDRYM